MLRVFAKMTIRKTPTEDTTAMEGPNRAAIVPSKAVSAKVRIPRSLFDHSRSIPTRSPMPNDTAILAATSDGGKRSTNIDAQLLTQRTKCNIRSTKSKRGRIHTEDDEFSCSLTAQ